MNRALLRLSLACLGMFVLLLVNVNYVQAFRATSLADAKGNVRVFNQQFKYQRGSIKAGSRPSRRPGWSREQRLPAVLPDLRSTRRSRATRPFGRTGLEEAENSMLSGTDP